MKIYNFFEIFQILKVRNFEIFNIQIFFFFLDIIIFKFYEIFELMQYTYIVQIHTL